MPEPDNMTVSQISDVSNCNINNQTL